MKGGIPIHLYRFALIAVVLLILISSGVDAMSSNPKKTSVSTENAPKAIGPYSQAVECGDMLFISGQIGIDPVSGNISAAVENQTGQVMENLKEILKRANMSFEDVVQARIYGSVHRLL